VRGFIDALVDGLVDRITDALVDRLDDVRFIVTFVLSRKPAPFGR
jgi:hypothetical protein